MHLREKEAYKREQSDTRREMDIYTVGRFLNAWLNVCVSGKKGKLRV